MLRIAFGRAGFAQSEPCRQIARQKPDWSLVDGDGAEWEEIVGAADVIVPLVSPVGERQLRGGAARMIQQFGVGLETLDFAAAVEHHVPVCNLPSDITGNADSVAELAVAMTLTLVRDLDSAREAARVGNLNGRVPRAVYEQTIALVGLGAIGSAIAKRLAAFSVTLIGVRADPHKGSIPGVSRVYGTDDLAAALSTVDGVILCRPGRADGEPVLTAQMLAALPRGAFIVNVGRGSLIDETALLAELNSGRLSGAGLDVYAHEPLTAGNPLAIHPRVMATPHIAGSTQDMMRRSAQAFISNVERMEAGAAPLWQLHLA